MSDTVRPTEAYRPDIDGLRGIAILGVVLYHLEIGPLHGGFVGVDVFFVISGFLITNIIQREIATGTFSFRRFYERRIRRIFPAFFAVLLFTLVASVSLFLPSDLFALGKTSLATLLFASNVLFWRTSGYFDVSAELNPLLHTWSLAVEEQFYIGLPIVLLLVARLAPRRLRLIIGVIAIISLAACVTLQGRHSTATFYLSPFRAWELSVGALLAVGAMPAWRALALRQGLAIVALILLALSLTLTTPGPTFPGWQALLPVGATAMLIHAGTSGDSVARQTLSFGPLVFVGRISYSLYLWYLPLLTLTRYGRAFEPIGSWNWAVLAASITGATITYHLVEQPFRARRLAPTAQSLFVFAGVATISLGVLATALVFTRGVPSRFGSSVLAADSARSPDIPFRACIDRPVEDYRRGSFCTIGDSSVAPTAWIWGDSHALAWTPAFDEALRSAGRSARLALESACPPVMGIRNASNPDCKQVNDDILSHLRRPNDTSLVILIAAWNSYANEGAYELRNDEAQTGNPEIFPAALSNTVATLNAAGKRVWIVGPTPGGPPGILLWRALNARSPRDLPSPVMREEFSRRSANFVAAVDTIVGAQSTFVTFPGTWFCADRPSCDFMRGEEPLYRDGGHLSVFGARSLVSNLSAELRRVAK
jgi:peptidoglycan/LPS O-acetylase OafA/YrhL